MRRICIDADYSGTNGAVNAEFYRAKLDERLDKRASSFSNMPACE